MSSSSAKKYQIKYTTKKFIIRECSYCFQRVLAIAILSVCLLVRPSVCHIGISVKNSHQIFTVNCLENSSVRNRKAFP